MDILITGAQILIGCLFVAASWHWSVKAMNAAVDLQAMGGRLKATEMSLESLYHEHKKLAGRFYQADFKARQGEIDPRPDNFPPTLTRDELRRQYLSVPKATSGE